MQHPLYPTPACRLAAGAVGSFLRRSLQGLLLFFTLLVARPASSQNYIGVWRGGSDGYYLWSGVDWNSFVAKWNELGRLNLRLMDIETYVEGGRRLYSGVWRGGSDGYYLWAGVTWSNFVAKWNELGRQNMRLIDIETYVENGVRLYIGVWRGGSDGYYLWSGVTWSNFVAKWNELGRQNLRLVDIETYVENGVRLYSGVWRGGSDGYYLWAGVDWNNFVAKWNELGRQNMRLIDIEMYEDNGRKYIGVWRSGSDGYYLWAGVDWENITSKWYELGQQNLRLNDIEIYPSSCIGCENHVIMPDDGATSWREQYNYGITATTTHCEGRPGTCPTPPAGGMVFYRWPAVLNGNQAYIRFSAIDVRDRFLTLPFQSGQSMSKNGWRYSNGGWHHALDYSRTDGSTFKVVAAAAGRVIHIGWDNWSGNTIVISHDVGGVTDAYRTIYMHLRDGASNDCSNSWSLTVPTISGTDLTDFKTHLTETGCSQDGASRNLKSDHWGTNSETIDKSLLGKTVSAGQVIAWAGNTGPGGKRGSGGPNTHLHIFYARRDPTDNRWYFFDPYGIYDMPNCYPSGVTDAINTPCARYPNAWRNGVPQYQAPFLWPYQVPGEFTFSPFRTYGK
ncbi:M23 family metallopeptidase [Paraflavisolibacter sp. H34]|uniref:M23 family metallopeptidase n=1 Tax=Huijunlia imazamoxiresistens TaxID=3127457 RepID=UPI0030183C6D